MCNMPSRAQLAIAWSIVLLMSSIYVTTSEELLELSCTPQLGDVQCKQYEHTNNIAICNEGHCQCTDQSTGKRTKCQPKNDKLNNIISGPCPCTQLHAECNEPERICYCKAQFVPSEDRRRCLPVAVPLAGACELSSQCQYNDPFSVCHMAERKCMCKPGFDAYAGKCVATLEMSCNTDSDCGCCGAAVCLPDLRKCACFKRFVQALNGTKCIMAASYDTPCTHSTQCQLELGAGGICQAHKCECREQYYALAIRTTIEEYKDKITVCRPLPVFGSYCRNHSDCHQLSLDAQAQRMDCRYGECICRDGFNAYNNINCLPKSSQGALASMHKTKLIALFSQMLLCYFKKYTNRLIK